MPNTSLARYRYFFMVSKLGSVRAASEALDVEPSAISRQISRLAAELGVKLIDSDGRGIALTPAGHIVAQRALQIIEAVEQARTDLDDLIGLRRGHVRVQTVEGNLNGLVLPAIAAFRREWPAITFDLRVNSSDRVISALLAGETDIGVAFNSPEHSDLRVMATLSDSIYAVVHPAFDGFSRRTKVSLTEVAQLPLALPDQTFGLRHLIDRAAKICGVLLSPVMITDSIDALRGFARAGIGVSLLPRLAVANDVKGRTVKAIPIGDESLRIASSKIIVHAGRSQSAAVRRMTESLAQFARTFPGSVAS